jgi:hypothetical protein
VFFIDLVLRIHRALDKEAIREHVVVNDRDLVKASLTVALFLHKNVHSSVIVNVDWNNHDCVLSSQFGDLLEVQLELRILMDEESCSFGIIGARMIFIVARNIDKRQRLFIV